MDGQISKETTKLNKKLAELVPMPTPDFKAKFSAISHKICEEITKSCRPKIEEINKYIVQEFTIPENVVLIEDLVHMNDPTEEDEKFLAEECDQLEKTVNEVSFLEVKRPSWLTNYYFRTPTSFMLWGLSLTHTNSSKR